MLSQFNHTQALQELTISTIMFINVDLLLHGKWESKSLPIARILKYYTYISQ